MGSIFEAFNRNRGESEMIALFRGSAANKAEKLLDRIRLLMSLSHPSLALPLDVGRCDEGIFVVTPSARQSITLDDFSRNDGPNP